MATTKKAGLSQVSLIFAYVWHGFICRTNQLTPDRRCGTALFSDGMLSLRSSHKKTSADNFQGYANGIIGSGESRLQC